MKPSRPVRKKTPQQELDGFLSKYTPEIASDARKVLVKMRSRLTGAIELVYDNYNALAIGFGPTERASDAIFSIAVFPRWVSLFFFQGTKLEDPEKLLRGGGKKVRHIVLGGPATLDRPAVKALMNQALERAPKPLDKKARGRLIIKSISAKQRPRRPAETFDSVDRAEQNSRTMRKIPFLLAILAAGCGPEPDYDLVLRNGTVFDGSGRRSFEGDVAFEGDRIAAVGRLAGKGAVEIDATGLYVAPGFIDMHSHSEEGRLLHEGRGPSFAFQGFTTEIYGETTSMGPLGGKQEDGVPASLEGKWTTLGEFLTFMEQQGIDINVASYVGSGGIRAYVMGYEDRPPTESELEEMKSLVRQAMKEGAFGVSAGMSYVPNIYMSTDELSALVKEAAAVGGIYANHARTMNGTDPNAIREGIEIAEKSGAPLHFFHLNSLSSTRASEFLPIIDEARDRGIRVTGDSYTYTWGITGLSDYIPAWAQEGGREAMLARLRDPKERERIAKDFVDQPPYLANIGWHHVRLGVEDPEVNGKLVEEVSEMRQMPPEEVFMDVVLKAEGRGIVIDWNNEEETLRQVLLQPYVAGGTDGGALDLEWADLPPLVHPRHLGTAPRFLGTYVREEKLLSWEEAIRKLSSLPAEILGIEDRGMVKPGQFADVVVFDPETIAGKATFEDPFHYAVGMRHVFVNGIAVVRDAEYTRERPGRALRGPGYQP